MSSAWFIRRFVDPQAAFVFSSGALPPGAVPFDTFGADFGHHGHHCTYETLCARFGIADPRALWIGRIVHDLDLKEETFREPESATVGRLVEGLRLSQADDQILLSQGMATFEALYQSQRAAAPAPSHGRAKATSSGRKARSGARTRGGTSR